MVKHILREREGETHTDRERKRERERHTDRQLIKLLHRLENSI